jgi:hypothetical protein
MLNAEENEDGFIFLHKNCFYGLCDIGICHPSSRRTARSLRKNYRRKKIDLMQKGMDAVKARLKNSSSAQFRNVHFHRSSNGIPMTCGEVNAKDGLGDYIGFQRFISAGRTDLTLLENQAKDFPTVWNKFCQ